MNTKRNQGMLVLSALSAGIVSTLASPAWADNPIIQTSYTADPAPMVHEGTLYLYTSHDEDMTMNDFYTMNDWRLYSTEDMVNWTDLGTPAGLHSFNWSTDSAWAPQGIFRNGSYYLYVPLNNNTGARIGVGVSDNVAGPFMDPLGRELVQTATSDIDPTVFIDDDDQAYMYWGNETLQYVLLNEDMTSFSGNPTTVSMPGFTEGPWFYKRESLYYMIFAGMEGGTEKISYATSNSPTGPWDVRGDIMGSGSTFTNHAGIVDYKGRSYFFYHNSALPGGNDFKRSVCVEEFTYGDDGSIPRLNMSDEGPAAVDTLNPFAQVEAETIAFSSGLKTEVCDDDGAGMNVTSISNGDYIKVKEVDFLDGVTSFDARVSSASGNATIELHLDSQNGTLLGTCDVSAATSWTTVTCPVSGGEGKHDLFLTFTGNGNELFKFNWWKFSGPTMPSDGDPAEGAGGADAMSGAGGSGDTDPATGDGGTAGDGGGNSGMPTSGAGGSSSSDSSDDAAPPGDNSGNAGGDTSPPGGSSNNDPVNPSAPGANNGGAGTPAPDNGGGIVAAPGGSAPGAGTVPPAASASASGMPGNGGGSDKGCSLRAGAPSGTSGSVAAFWLLASALLIRRRRV